MPKGKSNVRNIADARSKRAASPRVEAMECMDLSDLFGSSCTDPTSARHTHVVMKPAPDGRHWAFDARRCRGVAAQLTAYAEWLDGPQDEDGGVA